VSVRASPHVSAKSCRPVAQLLQSNRLGDPEKGTSRALFFSVAMM